MNVPGKFEAVCYVNFLRVSPTKVRKVLNQVRYRTFFDSTLILSYLPNKSTVLILKALNSAVSNLKVKYGVDSSLVFIKEAFVNDGPVLKRFRPHAQGRAFSIKKRMSHITSVF